MSDTPLDRALAMVWARRTLTVAELMVAFSEKENEALKKEIAELKKYLPSPAELPEPAETYMMTQYLVDGKAHKPAHCLVVAKIYYDVLREDSVLQITALKKEIAALKVELADEKAIVDRIWAIFGTPSYEELKGRSIYDMITNLQIQLAVAEEENAALKEEIDLVKKEIDELYDAQIMSIRETKP